MDLNLQIKARSEDALWASYSCPCGCNPRLAFERGSEQATDGCCCGNLFAVGPRASDHVHLTPGFALEVQPFQAPWGEALQAAWAIGASQDPNGSDHDQDESGHGHGHDDGHEHDGQAATVGPTGEATDPACGMTVDVSLALSKDLHLMHRGVDYYFCGKGCKLEFGDDPARFLDPAYTPSM